MDRRQTDVTQPAHSDHDLTLVAALAADDLTGTELTEARALVDDCPACAELHADLLAIATATRDLPAPVRPRDFRLTEEQAARLRPSGWRRLLVGFGSPRLAVARPVGVAMATIGLAGLLLSAAPVPMGAILAPMGGQTAAERDASSGGAPTLEPNVDTSGGEPPAVPGEQGPTGPEAPDESPAPSPDDGEAEFQGSDNGGVGRTDSGAPEVPWLPIGSIALVGGGVALVLLRRAAERA